MAELSICVRCSVVQAGTWGLPSVEPELLLQLLQSACERTVKKLPVPASSGAFAYSAGVQGQRMGSACYSVRGRAWATRPIAQGSPDHCPHFGPPQTHLRQKKQFFE